MDADNPARTGARLSALLDAGERLSADDKQLLCHLIRLANRKAQIAVWIWLSILVILIAVVWLLKSVYGVYDKGINGVVASVWLLSIGVVQFLPDYKTSKIIARLKCKHCQHRLTPKEMEDFIESDDCVRCGHSIYGDTTSPTTYGSRPR